MIVDCLTVWLANLFVHDVGHQRRAQYGHDAVAALAERRRSDVGPTVVVSNEVGMGVHPETPQAASTATSWAG